MDSIFKWFTAGFISFLAYMLGGVDNLLICLITFAILDYITGLAYGVQSKTVSSYRGFWGIGKKILLFTFVIVAHQLDQVMGNTSEPARTAVILMLIGTEGISILENMGKLGFPVPKFILNTLEQFRDSVNGGKI